MIHTSGCALKIAILLDLCGSSVINHRKSLGSLGGALYARTSGFSPSFGENTRRGVRPSDEYVAGFGLDFVACEGLVVSAPPYKL